VTVDFGFSSDVQKNLNNMKSGITFDLMVFDNNKDYLCYVEAVHQLQHQNIKRPCDFIYKKSILKDSIYALNLTDEQFLTSTSKAKEYFFVIDNTDYPEAIFDESWIPVPIPKDGSKDVYITLDVKTTFTSNGKYFFWTWIFGLILIALGGLLFFSFVCYCRQSFVYNRYAKERKQYKQQLL